jgi:mRNA-degrading endonuclease toxin of MazEF toxin-antitoxin module
MFQPCEVVLLPFPFSDLSSTKRRPALILRNLETYGDIVALAITSRSGHPAGVPLELGDFELGSLPKLSWVRCDQVHTDDHAFPTTLSPGEAVLERFAACGADETPVVHPVT